MKHIIRRIVAFMVRLATKHACKIYGEVAELSDGPCKRCVGMQVTGATDLEDTLEAMKKYHELIFAVESKYPGETRHETALRYIRQAETHANGSAQTYKS